MKHRNHKVGSAFGRAVAAARGALFGIACKVLLPISTTCKVCNILLGIAIGMAVGASIMAVAVLQFWRCF